ncbi:uncharacterized protein LOC127646934 [Xyrauchen texanus]|uniref:uncharacterized protein LOC127646934 n=1 Tax=Xyrauchen texanus TaxID=154827 RepID=UPI002242205B|nr:uncharacterized protein LOC127646934 [Xyrauchen texanus]
MTNCVMCSPSPLKKLIVVPNQYDYKHCAEYYAKNCGNTGRTVFCPAECLAFLGHPEYDKYYKMIGWGDECRKLDIRVENEKKESPLSYTINRQLEYECFNKTRRETNVGQFKGNCAVIWHLDEEMFSNNNVIRFSGPQYATVTLGQNFTANITPGCLGVVVGHCLTGCENQTLVSPARKIHAEQTETIADYFWLCGGDQLKTTLPKGWKGLCTRVRLIQEVTMVEWDPSEIQTAPKPLVHNKARVKRAYAPDPGVYMDAIVQPRGIPQQFKARNEIKSGFESIFVWVTPNKNLEWINYIYYNQQRFINYTDEALEALGHQLSATSKMAWQNRQALNWLLADKGGVCVMFGADCCTYIPNNTSPEGAFTQAMKKLHDLRKEVKSNAGRDQLFGQWFDDLFGSWKIGLMKIGIIIVIGLTLFALLFCCIIPILRSIMTRTVAKQMVTVSMIPPETGLETRYCTIGPGLDELDEIY